jgi:hypothetical protein
MATIENVKFTIANLVSEFATIASKYDSKMATLRESMLDEQGKLVSDTHIKGNYSDVQIAEALGLTKSYVGKLIARGIAVKHGYNGTATAQALDTAGNDVTVGALKRIGKQTLPKSERVELLANLGVPVTGTESKPRTSKTVAERTEADIATLRAIVNRAIDGKTTIDLIYSELFTLEADMSELLDKMNG